LGIVYLRVGAISHIVGKLSTRVATFLETSPQLKVYTRIYGLPKLHET